MKTKLASVSKYRLKQAKEALADAEILFNSGGGWRSTINRAYYAMFYSVLALIAKRGLGGSKHSGVISIFDREYVKKSVFNKRLSQLLHRAFTMRQESDYREFFIVSKKETQQILLEAKGFIQSIEKYLTGDTTRN